MAEDRIYQLYHDSMEEDFAEALARRPRGEWLTANEFTTFSAVIAFGFKQVCYESQLYEMDQGTALFWITDLHAEMIGKALAGATLDSFMLTLTRLEHEDGFDRTIEESFGASVGELTISHKSGDEETPASMQSIARLAHHLGCRRLAIWAAEYEDGSLAALAAELTRLENRSIVELDICDVSLPEPDDQLSHPDLEAFLARNR